MKIFSKALITVLIAISMLSGVANCATLEQVKKTQVQNVLKTDEGKQIKHAVDKYSKIYKIDPVLIHAVILTESGYNPRAVSSSNARGLMQLMPGTFAARGVGDDIHNIDQNIHAGVKHLKGLESRYKGNTYLALAAYLMGGGALDRYNGSMPSYAREYVNKVYYHRGIVQAVLL